MPIPPPLPRALSAPRDASRRMAALDALRGVALLAMAVYHACWDLTFLGLADLDLLGDPLWLAARTIILGTFLLLAGISLVLAAEGGLDRRRFLRRLGQLALAAAAVSAVSYALFPDSPIFFGVLHHIAVASLLGLAALRLPWPVTAVLGVAVIAAGRTLAFPLFDEPWLRWIGLMTVAPDSNDYVPLFPWFGVVLLGIAFGRLWRGSGGGVRWRPTALPGRLLAGAGRHGLAFYLIHQPLLYGACALLALGLGVDPPEVRNFLGSCETACVDNGGERPHCTATCRCVVDGIEHDGLWDDFMANRLNAAGAASVNRTVAQCGRLR